MDNDRKTENMRMIVNSKAGKANNRAHRNSNSRVNKRK